MKLPGNTSVSPSPFWPARNQQPNLPPKGRQDELSKNAVTPADLSRKRQYLPLSHVEVIWGYGCKMDRRERCMGVEYGMGTNLDPVFPIEDVERKRRLYRLDGILFSTSMVGARDTEEKPVGLS